MRKIFLVALVVLISGCEVLGPQLVAGIVDYEAIADRRLKSTLDLSEDQLIQFAKIKFLDEQVAPEYFSLGLIGGRICARNLIYRPTEQDVRDDLKIKAMELYADAILNLACSKTNLPEAGCQERLACTGEAIVIKDSVRDDGSVAPIELVDMAAREISFKKYDERLWVKALALASGDEDKRNSIYIKLRSKQLADNKKQTDEIAKLVQQTSVEEISPDAQFSGTYISYITSNSKWHFLDKYQRLKIEIKQDGKRFTAMDDKHKTRISGTIESDVIRFHVDPGVASGFYDAEGEWRFDADENRLDGFWSSKGGVDDGAGKWSLIKMAQEEEPISLEKTIDPEMAEYEIANLTQLPQIGGTYISKITSNSRWHFLKKYQNLEIEIKQDGKRFTAIDHKHKTRISGTIEADVIRFHVDPGVASGFYDAEGEWRFDADENRLDGFWGVKGSSDAGSGEWKLIRIE